EDYSPGWKFNEWEMKGVPLRIEIGPKDLENKQVMVVRRDTGKKEAIKIKDLKKKVPDLLENIQKSMLSKAKKQLKEMTIEVKDFKSLQNAIKDRKIAKANWCGTEECEDLIKDKTDGAKSLNAPFKEKASGKCVHCGKKAETIMFFGKSY
ncbi:MAG: His/Gly/Thr/Pro-type tRNA ligase C-terminal domain-containing protein, partial [Candidatus Nanoarchaeia archaeon]|nr:His/Gly/Thr/Pro-type tRNA ligase C-terminal domain-containing protein [Candidatus Nanoarchaeia archaeon]